MIAGLPLTLPRWKLFGLTVTTFPPACLVAVITRVAPDGMFRILLPAMMNYVFSIDFITHTKVFNWLYNFQENIYFLIPACYTYIILDALNFQVL